VRARSEEEGGGIEIRFSREAETTPDLDTGINDFAGYRIYRQEGSRLAPWEVVCDVPASALQQMTATENAPFDGLAWIDPATLEGYPYWYSVVAYDDGSQNWAEPGVSLESSAWWTWTGYVENGVIPGFTTTTTGVEVSGTITTQTWTADQSPYRVTDTITVPAGETLTIQAGVDVQFNADVPFVVDGAIRAYGTGGNPVRFRKGTAEAWGGVRISGSDSSSFVYTQIMHGNTTGDQGFQGGGLAVTSADARLTMTNCTVSSNISDMGGGVSNAGTAVFTNCIFTENSSYGRGGGLYNTGTATLTHCTFAANVAAGDGGGIANEGTISLSKCVLRHNTTPGSGGGLYTSGTSVLTNCTIRLNTGDAEGGGIFTSGNILLTNSIVYGNTTNGLHLFVQDGDATVNHSNIEGGLPIGAIDGGGNLDVDPMFSDRVEGDVRLSTDSPCIDAGDPDSPLDPDGTRADMGAFPFYLVPASITGAVPVPFALAQNAPNPFNPVTSLRFSIPEACEVILAIYDVNGRLVRTLVDGDRTAGMHEVVWDARDDAGRAVASGVYVYRLTAGADVAVRRMILVR